MIVLDSSFLIAFHNERDKHHGVASDLMNRFLAGEWGKGLLLEYVYLEVVTVLLVRRNLSVAVAVGQLLLKAIELEFVYCSESFSDAVWRFGSQVDTQLSLVDSAIAGIAESRAEGRVLSFDREFYKIPSLNVLPPN